MKGGVGAGLAVLALGFGGSLQAVESARAMQEAQRADEGSRSVARDAETVILAQLEAFNSADVDAMVANVSEDFTYFSVDSDYTTLEIEGRDAFRFSMESYFGSTPGARAEIEQMFPAGEFVAVLERAYWLQDGSEVSQASLAVYEVRDDRIRRVWYYPVIR